VTKYFVSVVAGLVLLTGLLFVIDHFFSLFWTVVMYSALLVGVAAALVVLWRRWNL